MTKVRELHRRWLKEPAYRRAHEELALEFELARDAMRARIGAGLTQEQLARRMKTTQSVIARLESGRVRPSMRTLQRLADATGSRLKISLERRNVVRMKLRNAFLGPPMDADGHG